MTTSERALHGVRVRVPATSANLGSAFDSAGIAVTLYNDVTLAVAERAEVVVVGEGKGEIGAGAENLVARAAYTLFDAAGVTLPPLHITMRNRVPLGRGLGSSSSAIVAGLVGGNVLAGSPFNRDELLRMAVAIEGHGDNVTAALLGGLTIYVADGRDHVAATLAVPAALRLVFYIPEMRVPTSIARAVLPKVIPRQDALFNIGRAALLIAALSRGDIELLRVAMQDRLHQPYRSSLFPAGAVLIEAALEAGAVGSAVSGAGPSIVAIARDQSAAIDIALAFGREADRLGVAGSTIITRPDRRGARLLPRASTRSARVPGSSG